MSDTIGRLSLWQAKESDNENAPVFTGQVEVGETTYRCTLWKSKSAHPKAPAYTGVIEDNDE